MSGAPSARERLSDLLARAAVASLFAMLAANILANVIETGRVIGFFLLASESLVVVLTVLRRPASVVDRTPTAFTVTVLSGVSSLFLRASSDRGLLPEPMMISISAVGLAIVIVGKLALGRSFGIVPANRGVVVRGPYAYVRHPIYAGYILTNVTFILAYPTWRNVILAAITDIGLVIRVFLEERTLAHDDRYQTYTRRVVWHLVPGLF